MKEYKFIGIIYCVGRVGGIVVNMNDFLIYMVENLLMGLYFFFSVLDLGVKKVINLVSFCVYFKYVFNFLKESDLLNGFLELMNEGYVLVKFFVMKYCEYVSVEKGVFYKILVFCNFYGEFDKFEEKIAYMIFGFIVRMYIVKLKNEKEFVMWGDGMVRREYLNVKDLVRFIFLVYENIVLIFSVMNVGFGVDYSIEEYYEMVV